MARGCECIHERVLNSGKNCIGRQPFSLVSFVTGPDAGRPRVHPPVPRWTRRNLSTVHDDHGRAVPASLLVAASLAGLEGLLVLTYAVVLAADIHADRAAMGVTTSLFFALLAGMLIVCAWYVAQARTWARSPIVVVQVMALGLAWNFLGGDTTWLSVLLAVAAVVVLVGLLHPASIEALSDHRQGE